MITLILKSYLSLLISIGAGAVCILIAGIYLISKLFSTPKVKLAPKAPISIAASKQVVAQHNVTINDMAAIAGDDLLSTQLDLARAYLETEKKHLAKKILEQVLEQGSATQQMEARQLLSHI